MLLIGKPSISMGHLYHGYVSHNQRVKSRFLSFNPLGGNGNTKWAPSHNGAPASAADGRQGRQGRQGWHWDWPGTIGDASDDLPLWYT